MIKYINNIAGILILLNIFDQILSSSKIIPENIYFDIFVVASYVFFGTEFILRIIIIQFTVIIRCYYQQTPY